ncbi:MAG: TolC family protein [Pirellulaceae bacterium]|nr:TolC family protein [Pirellulaceae bacterium]
MLLNRYLTRLTVSVCLTAGIAGCSTSGKRIHLPSSAFAAKTDAQGRIVRSSTQPPTRYRLVSANSEQGFQQPAQSGTKAFSGATEESLADVSIANGPEWSAVGDVNSAPLSSSSEVAIVGALSPRDASSEPDQYRIITESEMLSIALAHSPVLRSLGIRILDSPGAAATIYDAAIADSDPFFGPQAALAEFDSVLSASLNAQNNDRVFNNATLGGQVQELTQDLVNLNAGWQKRSMTGATWEVNSLTGYDNNNRAGNRFPNYWETQLEAGVRQPLLQGAGREFNRIAGPNARPGFNFSNGIIIAQMNTNISQADFEIALRDYVSDLYSAYWDLVRQYRTYDSVLASRELAYDTWQTVLAKGQAELEGGEANKEAQARAKYYSYRREAQVALGGESGNGGLYVTERRLRQLMGLTAVDGQLLKPADSPATARFVFDFDHTVARAMAGRTELRRQSTKLRQQQLRLVAAKNFMLPQMDLIGRYRLRGFGDDLTGDGQRFRSAYQDFFSMDHQEWEFGLEMGVVQGRRQARAAVRNAHLQLARERAILAEQQRLIRHQVSDAVAEVASSYYAMESSRQQVDASRERLQSSEALYEADKIQIEFLLDAQEELLRAELQLAADESRYSLSLIDINNTSGTLLDDLGIDVIQTACGTQIRYYQPSLVEIESGPSSIDYPTPEVEPVETPEHNSEESNTVDLQAQYSAQPERAAATATSRSQWMPPTTRSTDAYSDAPRYGQTRSATNENSSPAADQQAPTADATFAAMVDKSSNGNEMKLSADRVGITMPTIDSNMDAAVTLRSPTMSQRTPDATMLAKPPLAKTPVTGQLNTVPLTAVPSAPGVTVEDPVLSRGMALDALRDLPRLPPPPAESLGGLPSIQANPFIRQTPSLSRGPAPSIDQSGPGQTTPSLSRGVYIPNATPTLSRSLPSRSVRINTPSLHR